MTEDKAASTEGKPTPKAVPKEERERRKQVRRRWQLLQRVRQAVQLLLLALFLFLVYQTTRKGVDSLPVNLFSRFDPLMALVSMVAARKFITNMIPALVTIVVTLALGRVWCGWICPMGTVLDLYGPRQTPRLPEWFRKIKYFLFFAVLTGALLGSLAVLWLDPITIFVRPLAGAVYPAILRQTTPVTVTKTLTSTATVADKVVKAGVPTAPKPFIYPLLAVPLVILLALNLLGRRFWCRYLCPLGAWVALLSKFAWFKRNVSDACVACKACSKACPMQTIDQNKHFESDPGECLQCWTCFSKCPTAAIYYEGKASAGFGHSYDPSRRQMLASLVVGVGGTLLLKSDMLKKKYAYLIRPPGAKEDEFLSKCIRCGQCVKGCPNNALHLSGVMGGLESLWTPILIPRIGPCDYGCNTCGKVCPTQAIPKLSLEEKRKAVLGTAVLNTDTCIRCLICIKECPVQGALVKGKIEGKKGDYPLVNANLCIGCGVCEYVCPVKGEAAIRVHAPGA
jgi:MauM/NapG family ferredoxin protein